MISVILYKTLIGAKPLPWRFDKIDGFSRLHDGNRYLVLFGSEKYNKIYHKIRYLKTLKSGLAYVISHSFTWIKVNSYDSLPLEETLTFHKVIILIKSINIKITTIIIYS